MGWRWGKPLPPKDGQSENIASRCTTYVGGNKIKQEFLPELCHALSDYVI